MNPTSHQTPSGPEDPRSEHARVLEQVGPYVGLGLQLAGSMVFFAGAGYLLDRWLGTLPWLLIAGSLLGMVAIFFKIYRVAVELEQRKRSQAAPRSEAAPPDAP